MSMSPIAFVVRVCTKPFVEKLTKLQIALINLRYGSGLVPIYFPVGSGHIPVFLVDVKTVETPEGIAFFLRCKESTVTAQQKMRRYRVLDHRKIKSEKGIYFYEADTPGADDAGLLIPSDKRRSGTSDPWGVTGVRRFDAGPNMDHLRDEDRGGDGDVPEEQSDPGSEDRKDDGRITP